MSGQGLWERDERVFVYLSERRARYASIARAQDGRLLILFTHQTEEQENDGTGDLFLARRTKDGRWWRQPATVYEGKKGEPRAYGTMTALSSGRIIAPFAEVDDETPASEVRILTSDDNGETWNAGSPVSVDPLCWAAPYGRPFELGDELVMPVFGALTTDDLSAARLCSGLLRSGDGVETWGGWSTIAGPDPQGEVSYEFPAVAPLGDGTLLAVMTARRLEKRPQLPLDVPQTLVRSYSSDGGRTWTEPQHLVVGSWAGLTRTDDRTLACSFAIWAGWGDMFVMFSHDGFRTIRHRVCFVMHGWLPGYSPTDPETGEYAWGRSWAREPIPLPPVAANLKGDWKAGHFGFSSGLALDQDHLMLAFGQRQQGIVYTDFRHEMDIPIEKERVETVSVVRLPSRASESAGPPGPCVKPERQWELAERWPVEEWRRVTGQPPDDVSCDLTSGRWVRMAPEDTVPVTPAQRSRIIGRERGYWVWKIPEGYYFRTRLRCSYSDDLGKTWREAGVEDAGPFASAVHPAGPMFEAPDGTVVAPVYGFLNDEDVSIAHSGSALCRSHDGGETWGDWSIIAYDAEERYTVYNETIVLPLPGGTWVAFVRSEHRSNVPYSGIVVSRSVSADGGRTWSAPEPCAAAGVTCSLGLPDGGIAVAGQQACNWGVTISYDGGLTWDYALPATYATGRAGVLDDETFWLYDAHGQIVSIYRLR